VALLRGRSHGNGYVKLSKKQSGGVARFSSYFSIFEGSEFFVTLPLNGYEDLRLKKNTTVVFIDTTLILYAYIFIVVLLSKETQDPRHFVIPRLSTDK